MSVAACLIATSGAAAAGQSSTTYVIKAALDSKHVVPVPKDATGARGVLTGKLTLAGKKSTFTWQLKVSGLSGRVVEAEVAVGAPGKRGSTVLALCKKCLPTARGGYTGPYVANKAFVAALVRGGMYASVSTKLNPKGEIRGQIKASSA